jgi:DNA-binding CsgD family transcriptional regulator
VTLIGRDRELATLDACLARDALVVVAGEAGIGKTTLVRAAAEAAERRLVEGGAFATLAWMPYLALERACGRQLSGDADWVADTVEAAVGPDVLFVDDAQWAAPQTLAAVQRLAGRIAVVVAIRRGDPGSGAAFAALDGVEATVVDLGPLDASSGARIAAGRAPGLGSERARVVARRAGGNPFLIEELAASGQAGSGEAPAGLRRTVAARLEGLPADDRRTLALLALADRPLPVTAVPAATSLVADGLAVAADDGVTVRHALLRDAILADLDAGEARALHARLAGLVADDGERARHLAAAGERDAAHALAVAAAADATAPGERAAHLGLAASTATGAAANALRVEAATALRIAGDLETAMAVLDELEHPDAETLALADVVRARVQWSSGDPEAMRASLERGLALVAGSGSRAEALLLAERVTVTALVDGRFDVGLADADAAIALATRAGADPTRAMLLRATILAGLGRAGWADALAGVVESARASGDAETELSAANNLVSGHEMHGDPATGRRLADAMVARSATLRLTGWERQFSALVANLDLHAGDLAAALDRSEALLDEALDPLARQQVGLTAALALVDLGRHEDARRILDPLLVAASPDVSGRGDVLFVLAEAAIWGGKPDEATAHVEAYREYEGSEYPTSFLVDVTAAWAAFETARPIPPRLAVGEPSGMLVGARNERSAIERLAAGDPMAAASAFDAAADAYAGFHRRGELRARWAAAEARRGGGESQRALADLLDLEPALADAGFVPLLGRVHRTMRLLGVRRSARSATVGPDDRLTAREREVATLVARGLTNTEIARRMGLGRPTVARLLSNGMGKLGVDSRGQVAARVSDLV